MQNNQIGYLFNRFFLIVFAMFYLFSQVRYIEFSLVISKCSHPLSKGGKQALISLSDKQDLAFLANGLQGLGCVCTLPVELSCLQFTS